MKNVTLTIDGRAVTVPAGTSVLRAALDNGIYIPNLCEMPGHKPQGSCRLCWVKIEGVSGPVLSCTREVSEGMVVSAKGEEARRLAKSAFALLMASHDLDCPNCPANGKCELQKIAAHPKAPLKPKELRVFLKGLPVDDSNPLFTYNPDRCILCGRCVRTCRARGNTVLGFAHRGFDRRLTTFGDEDIGAERCLHCGACVGVCPTGALFFKQVEN